MGGDVDARLRGSLTVRLPGGDSASRSTSRADFDGRSIGELR